MKLTEALFSSEISDNEKERIGRSLCSPEGRASQIFFRWAPLVKDFDFWRHAHKRYHINGFREGSAQAIKRILPKIIENLRSHPTHKNTEAWYLYKSAVRSHLERSVAALHQLITKETLKDYPGTRSEQVLRCIRGLMPLYRVSEADVRDLYEIWAFERTERFEEILGAPWLDEHVGQRLIESGAGVLRREFEGTTGALRTALYSDLERQAREHSALSQRLDRVASAAESELRTVNAELARLAAAPACDGQHTKNDSPSSAGAVSAASVAPSVSPKPSSAAVEELKATVSAVESQLAALTQIVKKNEELRQARMATAEKSSPPSDLSNASTTLAAVIARWRKSSLAEGLAYSSTETFAMLFEIIRSSKVIICDRPGLIIDLYTATAGTSVQQVAASPLWVSLSDWPEALSYICEHQHEPRLLVINDFDVAIQEAYLVPAIVSWIAQSPKSSANRIVLVPADSELSGVSVRAFELSLLLLESATFLETLEKDCASAHLASDALSSTKRSRTLLEVVCAPQASYERDLGQLAKNAGVTLPHRILARTASLYARLEPQLGRSAAWRIAWQTGLESWLSRARGEYTAQLLEGACAERVNDGETHLFTSLVSNRV